MTEQHTNGSDLNETAESLTARGAEAFEASLSEMQERLDDLTGKARDNMKAAQAEGSRFVRENPGTAVLGAIGVGVLIGLSLRQR